MNSVLSDQNQERIVQEINGYNFALYQNNMANQADIHIIETVKSFGLIPFKDGDEWCVLLGDNIQSGICGFGKTPMSAMYEFVANLHKN